MLVDRRRPRSGKRARIRLGETYDDRAPRPKPRFEVSASVLYLQPGAGNLDAINSYSLTQVAAPPVVGAVGVFLETQQHVQTDFTMQGPYVSGSGVF